MKNNRREFLKRTGLAGIGLVGTGMIQSFGVDTKKKQADKTSKNRKQLFNMCGYAAPKIDTVRVGFIGLGSRGPGHVMNMSLLEGVEIKGLCDLLPEEVEKVRKRIEYTGFKPALYSGDENAWKKLCENPDIDMVYICTPWNMHAAMAVYAMEHGKHVAIEVPAANTLEECWQLVEASEKTRKHCMMVENCCYDFFELLTLNMARHGLFGEIIHGEGAYIHDLLKSNFNKEGGYWNMWRLRENAERQGNLYPTHGLGPICQIMDINRGDKMDFLVSVMSRDFLMNETAKELSAKDDFFKEFVNKPYRGNMTTTTILTNKGRSIMVQHDVTSPNPYSRIHKVSGTKGSALKFPEPAMFAFGDRWVNP
jgi:predicted dehydrogenase